MEDKTRTTSEKLDVSGKSPFPSMLLIKKSSLGADASARAAETEAMRKRGQIMLDRLKNFVPEMASSARTLEEKLQRSEEFESLDIENVKEGAPVVEFNLGLFEYSSSESEDERAGLDDTDESASDSEVEAIENSINDNIVFLKKRNPGGSRQ